MSMLNISCLSSEDSGNSSTSCNDTLTETLNTKLRGTQNNCFSDQLIYNRE